MLKRAVVQNTCSINDASSGFRQMIWAMIEFGVLALDELLVLLSLVSLLLSLLLLLLLGLLFSLLLRLLLLLLLLLLPLLAPLPLLEPTTQSRLALDCMLAERDRTDGLAGGGGGTNDA